MENLKTKIDNIIEYNYSNKEKNNINIAYGIDNNYVRCVATSIASLIINNVNRDFIFHILGYSISERNKTQLQILAKKYKTTIIIYELNEESFQELPTTDCWTMAMYFRFIIPEILSEEKQVVYLDADIICLKNADELFDVDLKEDIIGAVLDIDRVAKKKEKIFNLEENSYFNSGMLIINIKQWNRYNVLSKVIKILKCNFEYMHPDQDALNLVLKDKVKYLRKIFNCIDIYNVNKKDIVMLHFANHPKPWNKYWPLNIIYTSFTANLYQFYEEKTPFIKYKRDSFKEYKQILKWLIKYILFKPIKRV